eukprot:4048555-Amphidinium_carterae.1
MPLHKVPLRAKTLLQQSAQSSKLYLWGALGFRRDASHVQCLVEQPLHFSPPGHQHEHGFISLMAIKQVV